MNISRIQLEGLMRIYQRNSKITDKLNDKTPKTHADEVSLSDDAREIANAIKSASKIDDVRIEKIEELKARIKSGNYNIDGKLVAEKIIDEIFTDRLV